MIRTPLESEIPAICALYEQRNYKEEVLHYSENSFRDCLNRIRVYVIDDKVVGFILFYDMGRWCFIDLLSVDKEYRGKGIGCELVKSLVDFKQWHYVFTSVIVDDEKALLFADKCGFKKNNQLVHWFYRENN